MTNQRTSNLFIFYILLVFQLISCNFKPVDSQPNVSLNPTQKIAQPCKKFSPAPSVLGGAKRKSVVANAGRSIPSAVQQMSPQVYEELSNTFINGVENFINLKIATKESLNELVESQIIKHPGIERGNLEKALDNALVENQEKCQPNCFI